MLLTVPIADRVYRFDSSEPIDISIPLDFHGEQPNAFDLPRASAAHIDADGFVGDTRAGGGVNCETVTFNPHGAGTHTECVGHIANQRIGIGSILRQSMMPALVVTVEPVPASEAHESDAYGSDDDRIISARALLDTIVSSGEVPSAFAEALVIRTLPNDRSKALARHSGSNPPYLSGWAMRYLRELGVRHLLVDLPSIDRERDGGRLSAHRIFWEVGEGVHDVPEPFNTRTITEMVYVDDAIADGIYMLNLQVPNFLLDAAPSRPLLYRVTEVPEMVLHQT